MLMKKYVLLLRGDYQSRMNGYATGRQNGWMSANDIRELENLDRITAEDGGDLYLINGNMTKLADAGMRTCMRYMVQIIFYMVT